MEEQREESASLGDSRVPLEESGKELGLASKTETLDPSIKDANAVGVLDSGVCDVSEADENPNGGGVEGDVEKGVSSDSVVIKTDALAETETERGQMESGGDADVKPLNGESHEGGGEEGTVNSVKDKVTDEEANKLSVAEEAGQEKESAGKSDEDNTNKEQVNEEENVEAKDAKHSESVQVPEVTNEEAPGTVLEVSPEEDTTTVNHEEENGEAMDIDYTEEETVEKVVLDDAGNESAVASVVPTQDVTVAEADRDDSNVVKEMEVDNSDMASELTGTVGSTDSANPKVPTEDAAPGEVEPLDHNGLFDPRSDITSYIDFSGVSSWSGNVQDLKTETGDVSLKEADKGTEVATAGDKLSTPAEGVENESNEAPVEASDAIMGSDENQEEKDPQDTRREEDGTTHEAPSNDQHQKEDTVMEENQDIFDYADVGTDSDPKANGLKRKADVLNEDSLGEGKKNVSFKIGACIARAASQMAGTPSVLKGSSNLGDETLSVESFVSQLHSAATDPVKENLVSELATGFFLDFRNSSASQQFVPEKTSSKRAKQSNSNAGGTEAFEFEEMGDTYWTDRVIHNGGEEQTTPATEKENYQVVPVELKPAQVKRTRRPYRRRQSQISYPLPSASDKPADFDENAPAELIMYFSETDTIPSEKSLSKMFRHFGPIRDSQTEVDEEKHRARVVFRKGADAGVAYKSAGSFNIFGTKTVNYELSFTITETFKVQPYVVSLGEEVAAAEGGVEEAAVVSLPTETFKDQPYVVSLGEEEVAPAVECEEVAAAAAEGGEEEATVVSLPSETFKDQPYVESFGEEVAPAVEGEEVAPAVEGEEVAPAVEGKEVAPAVEGKEVAAAVVEGGEEEAAAVSLPS